MARIEGIDLPNQKRVVIGLTYIYGIGDKVAHDIVTKAGIPLAKRVHELSEEEVTYAAHTIVKIVKNMTKS